MVDWLSFDSYWSDWCSFDWCSSDWFQCSPLFDWRPAQTFAPVLCRPQGSAFMSLRHVQDLLKIQAVVRVLIENHAILSQNRTLRWRGRETNGWESSGGSFEGWNETIFPFGSAHHWLDWSLGTEQILTWWTILPQTMNYATFYIASYSTIYSSFRTIAPFQVKYALYFYIFRFCVFKKNEMRLEVNENARSFWLFLCNCWV